jgi:hypothetical protein
MRSILPPPIPKVFYFIKIAFMLVIPVEVYIFLLLRFHNFMLINRRITLQVEVKHSLNMPGQAQKVPRT